MTTCLQRGELKLTLEYRLIIDKYDDYRKKVSIRHRGTKRVNNDIIYISDVMFGQISAKQEIFILFEVFDFFF